MASRTYDVVIFGATGFTGTEVVKQFHRLQICRSWAVGGRRREPLEKLQQEWKAPGLVIADVKDYASLLAMARSTRLVLNATGPYRFLGEPVVRACIEGGADYLDLCGEPEFMERMLLEHGDAATEAGVLVCSSCAFDSVPADLGVLRCAQLFQEQGGRCDHVEFFHTIEAPLGYTGHLTTFEAAVHGIGAQSDLAKVRKRLVKRHGPVPKASAIEHPLPKRSGNWFYDGRLGRYAVPFPGSDASVVRSTRRTLVKILRRENAEALLPDFAVYFTIASRLSLLKLILAGCLFRLLASWEWGRRWLLRHHSAVTFGAFSEAGPTREQMENNRWIGEIFAVGSVAGTRRQAKVRAELADPGYIGTAIIFATVAQTVLEDRASLTAPGGVFTPGALFLESSLLRRLEDRGLSFDVVESDFT